MSTKMDCFECQAETEADILLERYNTSVLYVVGKCTVCGWEGRVNG